MVNKHHVQLHRSLRNCKLKWVTPTHLLEGLESKTMTIPNADKNVEQQKFSFIVEEYKMVQPHWETVWQFLTKLDIFLLHDLAVVLTGIYPNELEAFVHTKPTQKCL